MPSLQSLLLLTLATLAGTSLAAPAPLEARADDAAKSLYADLFSSPTALGRFQRLLVEPTTGALLGGDALKKAASFDYNNAAGDKAGKISAAVAATFPLLVKQDIGTVVAFLGPCSLLMPHTHPQPESLVVTQGKITTGTLIPGLVDPSKGTGEIVQTLSAYQGTLFPAGSIHYQLNPACEPATFVASLPTSDPGTTLESQFFSLDGQVVAAALGFPDAAVDGMNIEQFRSKIPAALFVGVQQCLRTCGMLA